MHSYPVTPSLHHEGEMRGRSSNVFKSFIRFFYCWLDKLLALEEGGYRPDAAQLCGLLAAPLSLSQGVSHLPLRNCRVSQYDF